MGRPIVHHDGWFFEWSTITDAPRTFGMRREEFESYFREEYGREEFENSLSDRLDRAVKNGTSLFAKTSAEELIAGNRAGKNERRLSFKMLIQLYCVEQRDPRDEED